MFGISGYEYILIAIVALIVIGPKELPAVLRTLGQWTAKVRRMAAEFQGQFHEAMREAEMADLKKEVDNLNAQARGITSTFDDPMNSQDATRDATRWEYRPETTPEAVSAPKLEAPVEIKPETQAEPAPALAASDGAGADAAVAPLGSARADGAGQGAGHAADPSAHHGGPSAAAPVTSEPPAAAVADAAAAPEGSAPKAGEGAVPA
jgi:sec-independent protein translocase protein TatB